jgi:Alkylmercury lyase
MLFFRSEEHIARWCAAWRLERGVVFPLEQGWQLARLWYGEDRRHPAWRRRTVEEAEAVFASAGFTGDFWRLR